MKYSITALSIFLIIAVGAICIGQGKPTGKSPGNATMNITDHEKIAELQNEVKELRQQLAELTKKSGSHTHPLQNLTVAQLPAPIECNQTVVGWAATGIHREPVEKVCRQLMTGSMNVLVPGKEKPIAGPSD